MPESTKVPKCLRCREKPVQILKRQLCFACYQYLRRAAHPVEPKKLGRRPLAPEIVAERAKARLQKKHARKIALAERHGPIIELAKAGLTLQAIADQLGLTRERIRQILSKNDVNIREFRESKARTTTPEEKLQRRRQRIMERFLSNLNTTEEGMCWLWTGTTLAPNRSFPDYQIPRMAAHDPIDTGRCRSTAAYRVAYMLFVGPIPEGMQVDRICYNHLCCNPKHLQLLTKADLGRRKNPILMQRARQPRKSVCIHGHLMTGENLYVSPKGRRCCRGCARERTKRKLAQSVTP